MSSPFDELGDGVFRRRYESLDLNIGVVLGEAGAVVIDTRATHIQAEELRAEIASLTSRRVTAVINTHYHWDHVWGNARFRGLPIWAHVRCREFLEAEGSVMQHKVVEMMPEEYKDAFREVETVPPTHTFTAIQGLDLGDRTVVMSYHGRAHTDSDIVIHVPDADVTFMGDVIEEGAPPQFGSAFPLEWPVTLEAMALDLGSTDQGSTIVPGHGDVVDVGFVATQREELESIAAAFRAHPLDTEEWPPGPYPAEIMQQAWRRHREVMTGSG
jgi:glyoxylase-like metal-dependent hydrolase (beta-lactamase superfamily II)